MKRLREQSGFGMVELVIGSAVILSVTFGAITAISFYIKIGLAQTERVQAAYLLEEGLEAARFMRDNGFTDTITPLSTTTTYYLATTTAGWATSTTPITVEGITRTIRFDQVWRRSSDSDIVPSTSSDTKAVDANGRRVVVSVSWQSGSTTASSTAVTYITNLFND